MRFPRTYKQSLGHHELWCVVVVVVNQHAVCLVCCAAKGWPTFKSGDRVWMLYVAAAATYGRTPLTGSQSYNIQRSSARPNQPNRQTIKPASQPNVALLWGVQQRSDGGKITMCKNIQKQCWKVNWRNRKWKFHETWAKVRSKLIGWRRLRSEPKEALALTRKWNSEFEQSNVNSERLASATILDAMTSFELYAVLFRTRSD